MARRATRFSLLVAIGLALLVAVLAGRKVLSPREDSRAHTPQPSQPPTVESTLDDSASAASAGAGVSDRERILAWVARHKGAVSFDPAERFTEGAQRKPTWHEAAGKMPEGEVVAVAFRGESRPEGRRDGMEEVLDDVPDGVTVPVLVLDLPDAVFIPERAAHLRRIRGLRGFYAYQWITDDDVVILGEMRELEDLSIEGPLVTDASLVHLGRLTALRHLALNDVKVTGESGHTSLLPATLEVLSVHPRDELHDSFVTALPQLPNLRWLELDYVGITDAALPKVGTFTALQVLHLRKNRFSDAGIAHLRGLQQLEVLDLASSPITDDALASIANLRGLGFLGLAETRITSLSGIGALTRLHYLVLDDSSVTDEGLGALLPLKELRGLYLNHTSVTDRGLAHVGALSELRSLSLAVTGITDAGLVFLQGLRNLEELDLRTTRIGDRGLRLLTALSSLREIDVKDTGVTVDGLLALTELSSLRHVEVPEVSPVDAARLRAAMPECKFE